jgi:hypothetical protein
MAVPPAIFGPGILIATRTDISPGIAINVGFVNEFQMDFAGNTKQLYGQNQFALVAARGTIKATGKMKNAVVSGMAMNALFYGNTFSTAAYAGGVGMFSWNVGSTFTLSTASTTATQVGSSLTFDADLGITYVNQTAGLPLQRVSTGSEAAGKYSLTTGSPGLYNFSAADTTGQSTGTQLKITYTQTGGGGVSGPSTAQALTVVNQLIGTTPTFQLDYYTNLNQPSQSAFAVRVFACVAAKHALMFKLEDFMLPEFDFDIFANSAGQVYDFVSPSIS